MTDDPYVMSCTTVHALIGSYGLKRTVVTCVRAFVVYLLVLPWSYRILQTGSTSTPVPIVSSVIAGWVPPKFVSVTHPTVIKLITCA
jgi:hypothetical protein